MRDRGPRLLGPIGIVTAAAGLVLGTVGEAIALSTYVGSSQPSLAQGLTRWEAVAGALGFLAFWVVAAVVTRFKLGRGYRWKRLFAGVPRPLRIVTYGLLAYWVVSFVGLAVFGGIDNKGLLADGGHFYILNAYPARSEISFTEYRRQSAYPLWMLASFALWVWAIVLSLSVRRPSSSRC